mgnify:FL=1
MENALPVKFWGLDPLYWANVKLFIRDVFKLKNYPGFKGVYAISNHPIVHVLVVGYIVMVGKREKLTNYLVDDGTGRISCCVWRDQNRETDLVEATFGDLVTMMGKISTFREERQITVSNFYIETDPNAETFHWLDVMKLREIYEKPFELTENSKIATKPWLTSELEIEIDRLEESLKKSVAEHLEATDAATFSLDSLFHVGKVMEIMGQLTRKYKECLIENKIGTKQPITPRSEMKQYMKHTLRKLEKDGIVYCKPIVDFDYREYDFLSIKKDLSPKIIHTIREICRTQGESSCGIALSKIVASFKLLERYKNVPRARVMVGLEHLINNGDIYETSRDHYRIV